MDAKITTQNLSEEAPTTGRHIGGREAGLVAAVVSLAGAVFSGGCAQKSVWGYGPEDNQKIAERNLVYDIGPDGQPVLRGGKLIITERGENPTTFPEVARGTPEGGSSKPKE